MKIPLVGNRELERRRDYVMHGDHKNLENSNVLLTCIKTLKLTLNIAIITIYHTQNKRRV